MNPFESTIDMPLRFLLSYIKYDGESHLHRQFVRANGIGFEYIPERDVISVQKILPRNQTKGIVLDDETNTCEYELTFPEFVQVEIENQVEISKGHIFEQSKGNGKDQDAKLYSLILIDCLEAQKHLDNVPELNFRDELNKFIRSIFTYSNKKFEKRYPNTSEFKRLNKYFLNQKVTNETGFKLKSQIHNDIINELCDYLLMHEFIASKNDRESIKLFLKGEYPKTKINWTKELNELKFFIDEICSHEILERKPGQQWKNLNKIFTCHEEDLPENWHRNHNKLKDKLKRRQISYLAILLSPRN